MTSRFVFCSLLSSFSQVAIFLCLMDDIKVCLLLSPFFLLRWQSFYTSWTTSRFVFCSLLSSFSQVAIFLCLMNDIKVCLLLSPFFLLSGGNLSIPHGRHQGLSSALSFLPSHRWQSFYTSWTTSRFVFCSLLSSFSQVAIFLCLMDDIKVCLLLSPFFLLTGGNLSMPHERHQGLSSALSFLPSHRWQSFYASWTTSRFVFCSLLSSFSQVAIFLCLMDDIKVCLLLSPFFLLTSDNLSIPHGRHQGLSSALSFLPSHRWQSFYASWTTSRFVFCSLLSSFSQVAIFLYLMDDIKVCLLLSPFFLLSCGNLSMPHGRHQGLSSALSFLPSHRWQSFYTSWTTSRFVFCSLLSSFSQVAIFLCLMDDIKVCLLLSPFFLLTGGNLSMPHERHQGLSSALSFLPSHRWQSFYASWTTSRFVFCSLLSSFSQVAIFLCLMDDIKVCLLLSPFFLLTSDNLSIPHGRHQGLSSALSFLPSHRWQSFYASWTTSRFVFCSLLSSFSQVAIFLYLMDDIKVCLLLSPFFLLSCGNLSMPHGRHQGLSSALSFLPSLMWQSFYASWTTSRFVFCSLLSSFSQVTIFLCLFLCSIL